MQGKNRFTRLATAAGCLLWVGAVLAQPGPTSGLAGGTSDGYAGDRSTGASSSASASDASGKTTATSDAMIGTISKLDADEKTIELQGDRKLHVDPSTEIRRDGQKASFTDLHEGDEVRASFQSDDRSTVKRIEVTPGSSTLPRRSSESSSSSSASPSSSSSSSSSGR